MTCSFREIAERGSLRDFSLRDFIGGERQPESLRELCNLHADGEAITLLWQNTFLLTAGELELGCDYTFGPFITLATVELEGKPAVRERAPQFGHRLAQADYDVVCLCEIFDDGLRDLVIEAWEADAPLRSWHQGPPALPTPPAIRAPVPCPPSPIPPHAGAAAVRKRLGNSGLLSLIRRHEVVDVGTTVFTNRGSPLIDIDPYSAKGVLKLSIQLAGGVISIFSTHIYAGGDNPLVDVGFLGLDPPSVEHKNRVKRAEFEQLRDFVKAEQARHPERVCVVCGDFNRDGTDKLEEYYIDFMEIMAEANLRDLWALLQDSAGPTTIHDVLESVEMTREERCPVGDSLHCSERVMSSGGSRIDYIFVQDPAPEHTLDIFFRRPRRVYLEMDPEAGGLKYLSDHLGLDTVMYVRAR